MCVSLTEPIFLTWVVILTCDPFSRYSFPMGKNNLINEFLKLCETPVRIQPSNVSHAELRFLFWHMWRIILSHLCLSCHEIKFLIDTLAFQHVTSKTSLMKPGLYQHHLFQIQWKKQKLTVELENYSCCNHTLLLFNAWARFRIARNRWLQ